MTKPGRSSFAALLALACSQLVDVEPNQCATNADCGRFGDDYACVAGLCEVPAGAGGTGGEGAGAGGELADDRSGGAGLGEAGSVGPAASAGGEGGHGGEGDGGAAAEASGAGVAGQSGASGAGTPSCESHKQCFDRHDDGEPYACVAGRCVALKTPDCPLVLPIKDHLHNALKSSDAIVLGAFCSVLPSKQLGQASQNFDLALTELMEETNGIPAAGGKRRQVVMVVCHSQYQTQQELLAPARHLIDDLEVPGIVGTLTADDLQYVFDEEGLDPGTFFMSPLSPDQNLLDHGDDGLIWHMLSGPSALAVTYRPLLDLVITHQRNLGVIAPEEEVRVALVTATHERALSDIGTFVRNDIRFNGRTSAQNTPENFVAVSTSSVASDGMAEPSLIAQEILSVKPHVIVSAAGRELQQRIMPILEANWEEQAEGQPRPFYLLSPHQYSSQDLLNEIENVRSRGIEPPLHRRIAGINWAAAADRTVYEEYAFQLAMNYEGVELPVSGENFYDAAYYLLYAAAAAGQPLTGKRMALGMERLMYGPPSYAVGRRDLNSALTTLHTSATNTIELIGSMGPPAFDLAGGRSEAGSVYCINAFLEYIPDGLRYDPDSGRLTGTFPCWGFPALAPE